MSDISGELTGVTYHLSGNLPMSEFRKLNRFLNTLNFVNRVYLRDLVAYRKFDPLFYDILFDAFRGTYKATVRPSTAVRIAETPGQDIVTASNMVIAKRAIGRLEDHVVGSHVFDSQRGKPVNWYDQAEPWSVRFPEWPCDCPLRLVTDIKSEGAHRFRKEPAGIEPLSFLEAIKAGIEVKGIGKKSLETLGRWATAIEAEIGTLGDDD